MLDGVTIIESKSQKDELILEGNDISNVSQSGTHPSPSLPVARLTDPFYSCIDPGCLSRTEQGYP
jgi:hypothetical protein